MGNACAIRIVNDLKPTAPVAKIAEMVPPEVHKQEAFRRQIGDGCPSFEEGTNSPKCRTGKFMKQFRSDYGVYVCEHVFKQGKPVLLVIRDPDGYWQFLCGNENDTDKDCHLVGVGHLLDRNPSLAEMTELKVGAGAERPTMNDAWNFFKLDEE